MSLNLTIGTTAVVGAGGTDKSNPDPFRSFWVGYTYTVAAANKVVSIDKGYAALYLSHNSKQKPTAEAKLADFGPVKGPLLISDTLKGTDQSKLILDNLDYVAAEDVEGANQGMQLHLFRFDASKPGGIGNWVNDGWKMAAVGTGPQTGNTMPFWKRTVNYGAPRYAHFLTRHRNAGGLQAVAASLPFGSQSLFRHWLGLHNQVIPEVAYTATEADGTTKHWEEKVGPTNIVARQFPRGLAMVTMGVFGSLLPTDLLGDEWHVLMNGNNDFGLCRALARAASEGSTAHTLRQLASDGTDCVVVSQNDAPQEFFCLKFNGKELKQDAAA